MKLKICVAGITGWVGTPLAKSIMNDPALELVSGVSRSFSEPNFEGVLVYPSVLEAIEQHPVDVLIDYTHAQYVMQHVLTALENKVHVVVGTSGLNGADYNRIEAIASKNKLGVIAAGNFSVTATLLKVLAQKAASVIPNYEIMEYSSAKKADAPNGTSRELANALQHLKKADLITPIEETLGNKESRGATIDGVQVHAVRLPSFSSSNEILFGMEDENLRITQHAGASAQPYITGTLLAAKKVKDTIGLTRGIESLLF